MTVPAQPSETVTRSSWWRRHTKPLAALIAAALVGTGAGVTLALWSDTDHAVSHLRSGMVVFDVNDGDHDRTLGTGTGGYLGGLKSNPDDVTTFVLPTDDLIAALKADGKAATAIGIDALTDGPIDVAYTVLGADDGQGGSTMFADLVTAKVVRIAPGTACTPDTVGRALYEGPLAGMTVPSRGLIDSSSTALTEPGSIEGRDVTRNWRAGSEVLCIQLVSPGPQTYRNTATVTGSTDEDSGSVAVTAKDAWSGVFATDLDDGKDTVIHIVPVLERGAFDTDGDGLDDGDEINVYKTDPTKADTDGDGLDDGDEVNVYKTDPTKADTDGDGLDDGDEVNVHSTDPLDADSVIATLLYTGPTVYGKSMPKWTTGTAAPTTGFDTSATFDGRGRASRNSALKVSLSAGYASEIRLHLVAPSGTIYPILTAAGPGAASTSTVKTFDWTFDSIDLSSESREGKWTLRWTDSYGDNNSETLISWSLTF